MKRIIRTSAMFFVWVVNMYIAITAYFIFGRPTLPTELPDKEIERIAKKILDTPLK